MGAYWYSYAEFLSTPSGWRATRESNTFLLLSEISIHALRVEGDQREKWIEFMRNISIHALRVEGDICPHKIFTLLLLDFYPRPPGGGRHAEDLEDEQEF